MTFTPSSGYSRVVCADCPRGVLRLLMSLKVAAGRRFPQSRLLWRCCALGLLLTGRNVVAGVVLVRRNIQFRCYQCVCFFKSFPGRLRSWRLGTGTCSTCRHNGAPAQANYCSTGSVVGCRTND